MVTIKDIAKAAGVTHATVSRALNNEPGVSESLKLKIRSLAEQMNYVPNMAAKKLVRQNTNLIGLVWPVVDGLFFYNLSVEIQKQGAARGYPVIMSSAGPVEALQIFNQLAVDHIIFWNGKYDTPSSEFFREKGRFRGDMLTMGGTEIEGAHHISIDRRTGVYKAVCHLVELGHRRIAFAGAHPNKINGYMQGVAEFKLEYRPEYMIDPDDPLFDEKLVALLQISDKPTAFVAESQQILFRLIRVLRKLGIRVPADLSVVVYDDVPEMEIYEIPFTTVGPSIQLLAGKALDFITDSPELSSSEEKVWRKEVIPTELNVRRSTGAPPS